MKAFLMYPDRDFDPEPRLPANAQALQQDLELATLFSAMAGADKLILEIVPAAVLTATNMESADILYRQQILRDCLRNPGIVRRIYSLAGEAIENERKKFWHWGDYPAGILSRAVNVLDMFVGMLKSLRAIAEENEDKFHSDGFSNLFAMLKRELSPEYFREIQIHLRRLRFRDGVLMSAVLGKGNNGTNYVLRRPLKERTWIDRVMDIVFALVAMLRRVSREVQSLLRKPMYTFRGRKSSERHIGNEGSVLGRLATEVTRPKTRFAPAQPVYRFDLHPRDEAGARMLADLEARGINLVANALAQSTDHILSFFAMLRIELAFYIGCLNLSEKLTAKGEPMCFPEPSTPAKRRLSCQGLYDVCLALRMTQRVVGNDVNGDGKALVMITGANRGGKSTFLRSVGLGQLMMQCGMFVPAQAFSSSICNGLFTHYRREEDATMKSGKFDEELGRMNGLVEAITPNALFLFNESFAATNEREGSEIAGQITSALLEKNVRVIFVTHLYTFAHQLSTTMRDRALFLRANRQDDGERSFKLVEGEPLRTSFGPDLYRQIFGAEDLVPNTPDA